jgi:hypothetical protein
MSGPSRIDTRPKHLTVAKGFRSDCISLLPRLFD